MSNTITLKKSGVSGNAPGSSDLSLGEIALNYADGHLYYKSGTSATPSKINADNADTVDGFHLNQNVLTTSTPTFDKLRLTNGSDASLTSTDHAFQVGTSSGQNLIIDNNEIISRSNGSASILYLQNDGGDVRLGTNGGTSRLLVQDGSAAAPSITFNNDTNTGIYRVSSDSLGVTVGGSLKAQVNSSGIVSSSNVYSGTSGQFRNFAGVWKATTGATGNGFQFISPDATALTITSAGNATFAGSVTATSLVKSGGSSAEFLKADGSVDSSTYVSSSALSSYLPLAGGVLTGSLQVSVGGATGINIKQDTGTSTISGRLFFSNATAGKGVSIYNGDDKMMFQTGATFNSSTGSTRMTIRSTGNVGIGTTSPTKELDVRDEARIWNGVNGIELSYSNGNTSGIVASANNSGNLEFRTHAGLAAKMIIANAGNVGIGILAPTFKLHVKSDDSNDDIAYIHHDNPSQSSGTVLKVRSDAGDSSGYSLLDVSNNTGNALYVRGDRKVGIGNTSPQRELHVGTVVLGGSSDPNSDIVSTGGITLKSTSKLSFDHSYSIHGNIRYNGSGTSEALLEYQGYYGHHFTRRSGTSSMVIKGDTGNVGIGTTSPQDKLDVAGIVNSSNTIVSNATYTMFSGRSNRTTNDYGGLNKQYFKLNLVTAGPNTTGESSAHGFADLRFQLANNSGTTSVADIMTLRSGGNVGIGTTVPDAKLEVAGIVDGDFTALRLMNQKTYGSGTGTNEKVRFAMGISESGTAFSAREGFAIDVGVIDQSDSSNTIVNFGVRDGGTLGTYQTVNGHDKSVDFAGNVTIGSVDASVGKGLNIGDESPTIQLFDTTNNAKLLLYTQDSNSIIGTYSNHALAFYTNSTQALNLDVSQNATFAGNVNINSVFDFNTSTDLLTITNNQNTGGIKLSGGNSRIYFGNYRAIEGDQAGGTLYIGEGYGAISLMDDVTVSGDLTVSGEVEFSGISSGSAAPFVVSDGGTLSTRTAAEVLSDIGGQASISAPNAPASASVAIVGETVEVTFAASTTSNIDAYLVYSSIDGSDYGLISIVPPDDFAASMSIIDNAFDETGTQAYRVYAMKYGILSSAASDSVSYSVSSAEPTSMSVVNLNNAYYVQWNPPSSNARFVTAYNVYKHEHATQGSLSRGSASLVYSGTNTNYMYQISGTNNNNFHQFWVETTIA